MRIDVLTLFPKMFESPFAESIIGRAIKNNKLILKIHNLRDWATDTYGTVDDKPFGGGVGMVLKIDVIDRALNDIQKENKGKIILLSAKGKRYEQQKSEEFASEESLILICGHYEGVDERIKNLIDEEISIGDYVLTGGEIPAMAIIDSVVRLLPGVLGKDESNKSESFSEIEIDGKKIRVIEHPHFTRPQEYKNWKVPEELLSGDPKKIDEWKKKQILKSS